MIETSELYKEIVNGDHYFETSLGLGVDGVLLTEDGDAITFGGVEIMIARSGSDGGYRENVLIDLTTTRQLFANGIPSVGNCVAGEIDVEMIAPSGEIPRMAQLIPYVRATDGVRRSEWIQKGEYYIDTRSVNETWDGIKTIKIHGYDAMLKAEVDYVPTIPYPTTDVNAVIDCAGIIGVDVDAATRDRLNREYEIITPVGYSCREVLGYVAAMYGGNFIINDAGDLHFVPFNGLPAQTNYLIDDLGNVLIWDDTDGDDGEDIRILV